MTLLSISMAAMTSATVSKIGMPSKEVPPFPGVTPATISVPYSLQAWVWNCPVEPVIPWVRTRVFLLTSIAISSNQAIGMRQQATVFSSRLTPLAFFNCLYYLLRGFGHGLGRDDGKTRVGEDFFPQLYIGHLQANH